jgi:hypothetical protein
LKKSLSEGSVAQNSTEILRKHYETGLLRLQTGLRKGHEGVFQQAGPFSGSLPTCSTNARFRYTSAGPSRRAGLSASSCTETRTKIYDPLPATFDGFRYTAPPTPRHISARRPPGRSPAPPRFSYARRAKKSRSRARLVLVLVFALSLGICRTKMNRALHRSCHVAPTSSSPLRFYYHM